MSDSRPEEVGSSSETPLKRSAEDYVNAANAVIDIAEIAVSFIPGGSAAATVATKALKYAPKARLIINHLPDVAPVAGQVASKIQEKAPDALGGHAVKLFGAAKDAAAAVGEKGQAAGDAIKKSFDVRAQEKARREARRALLDGAGIRMSVSQFLENWDTQEKLDQANGGYLAYCEYCT